MLLLREGNRWEYKSLKNESSLILIFVIILFVIVDLFDLIDEVVIGFIFIILWLERWFIWKNGLVLDRCL